MTEQQRNLVTAALRHSRFVLSMAPTDPTTMRRICSLLEEALQPELPFQSDLSDVRDE